MTYCLGIKTRHGLVMASDSRTNAGYDQVNVCRKMHTLVREGERVLIILTSGSLSLTQSIMTLLRRLQSEGKTLLVVEHNTRVVQQIADEVLFLHQGHLMARGTPAEIISDPALAEIYFGGAI